MACTALRHPVLPDPLQLDRMIDNDIKRIVYRRKTLHALFNKPYQMSRQRAYAVRKLATECWDLFSKSAPLIAGSFSTLFG